MRMRGRLVPAFTTALLVILAGWQGEAATPRTCHWWHDLAVLGSNAYAHSFKLGYVAGFAQGAYTFISKARSEEKLVKDLVGPKAPQDVSQQLEALIAAMEDSRGPLDLVGFTTEQLVSGLDLLCADGANQAIDVHAGLKIVRWRLEGAPQVQIDRELERMRSLAAQDQ
jgi:hypothetical protein